MTGPVLKNGAGRERPRSRYRIAKLIVLTVGAGFVPLSSIATDCGAELEQTPELLADRRVAEAQELMLASTRKCPEDPQAYNLLGLTYDLQNHFTEARRAYRGALERSPKTASFYDHLAVSYPVILGIGKTAGGVRAPRSTGRPLCSKTSHRTLFTPTFDA
jgi:cytochrome c-type biogenesis protein CcmH/NrfG